MGGSPKSLLHMGVLFRELFPRFHYILLLFLIGRDFRRYFHEKFITIVMSMVFFLNWVGFSSLLPQKFVAIAMSIAYLKEVVDQVINDDMDGDNVSDTNQEDGIHRLIQDTFVSNG
jgi:hypothetical protein